MAERLPQEFRGYPLAIRRLSVAGREIELVGPANYESLLDDPRVVRRFEQDEFMPYWAEFWPACLLLAAEVAGWPRTEESAGDRPLTLELGCGLGLPALLAAERGHRVIASDYEDDALAFVEFNARRLGWPTPELRWVDWREQHADLRLNYLLASEVLYEARNVEPIARFAAHHLKPDGRGLIIDSFRQVADAFPRAAEAAGLLVTVHERQGAHPDGGGRIVRGRIFEVRLTNCQ